MMKSWSQSRPRCSHSEYYPVKDRLIKAAKKAIFLVDVGGGSGYDGEGLRQAFVGQLSGTLIMQDRPEIVSNCPGCYRYRFDGT